MLDFVKTFFSKIVRHKPGTILAQTQNQYDSVKGQVKNLERNVFRDWDQANEVKEDSVKRAAWAKAGGS